MSITVTLKLALKPEAFDAFCVQIREALVETRAFPGFVDISIRRHAEQRSTVIFIEQWETRAAYDAYVAFRTETGMMAALAEILTQPPGIDIWDEQIA